MKDNLQINLQLFLSKITFKSLLIKPPINAFHCYNVKIQPGIPSVTILLTWALQRTLVSILECHLTFCSATSGSCASIRTPGPNQGHRLWEPGLTVPWCGHDPCGVSPVNAGSGDLLNIAWEVAARVMADTQASTISPQQGQNSVLVVPVGSAEKASLTSTSKVSKPSPLWVLHHVFSRSTNVGMLIFGEKGFRVCV